MTFLLRLKRFCGFLFGAVFFLSGLLKLMDPVGAGLVVKEYFDFLQIGFMAPAAKVFGVTLALLETLVGAALVCGVWRKVAGMAAIVMQIVFTIITAVLLIFNPEMDCGCFGEAIHLTHLQTFIKNIILMVLILLYYIPSRHLGITAKRKFISFGIAGVASITLLVYSLLYIPVVDFTAYKPGAELAVAASEGGNQLYESVFTYQKEGKTKQFTLDKLPSDLDEWTFVSTETRFKGGISDHFIEMSLFDPRTQAYADSIAAQGKVMVISVYEDQTDNETWEEIEGFAKDAEACCIRPVIVATKTGNMPSSLQGIAYTSDYKTIISLNRSNGGMTYFDNGVLIKKWARRAAPDVEELKTVAAGEPTETAIAYESEGSLVFQGFLLFVCLVMLLL